MAIIDTHNHLYFPGFKPNFSAILERARAARIERQILIGIDELSCQAALNLAKQYPDFKVSVGLHPCDVDQLGKYNAKHHQYIGIESSMRPQISSFSDYFSWLNELTTNNPKSVVAFGETGFDQFHCQSENLLRQQTECFEAHLALCEKHNKTLIIHSRGAKKETLEFLKQHQTRFKNIRFVWHCFSEDQGALKATLDFGGYIGIGGISTYTKSNELRDIIRQAPIEALLTETDAPFLPPHQARKKHKLNEPCFLTEIIHTISEIKDVPLNKVENKLYQNAQKAFLLPSI